MTAPVPPDAVTVIDATSLAAGAPFFALLGAFVCGFFGRYLRGTAPGVFATSMVGIGFFLSLAAFFSLLFRAERTVHVPLWSFLQAGDFRLDLGFVLDPLSVTLMLIITGVGFLIHLYSIGYMHGDEGFARYFAGLNLFVASMLVLVMADSFLLMFLGWEGVGVCSFLLIGFWYRDRLNADAARKAFITNRVGDVGFLLAMFLTFQTFGTLEIAAVNEAAGGLVAGSAVLTTLGLLYLIAACGKSAQLPLHVWLPDAMAGPTPVSALIHAATMVTAGVYLVARAAPLFAAAPAASAAVAWVGALTALFAAFAALSQLDIKKILAYSTISQLGFMFVAVGVGAYWVGIFHVLTHAFFKALLFLAAGSVIHALGGEQDVRKMGGLGKHMRVTGTTALVGTLAISGVPLLSGFFSKDAILLHAFTTELIAGYGSFLIYLTLLATAVLTAFYMFRWYYLVFAGEERFGAEARAHLHESPPLMTTPLIVLAVLSAVAGFIGLPEFAFPNLIAPWLETAAAVSFRHPPVAVEWLLIGLSVTAAFLGLGLGYLRYRGGMREARPGALQRASQEALGFDALYRRLFVRPGEALAQGFGVVDGELIDKGLGETALGVGILARASSLLQSGFVRAYALLMLLGLAALVFFVALSGVLA
ncbi:NADH-quinone oxidoreductase subunit L [Truepera radiovictrix]|uniref:Proton-translocating NADH-quinone oxidoreductase, chain L n=1 Tax=Truepera radiovictrix (strain DSM 17093 / CIP 108686 / LMG 22925 / RQ-24) TaxID=649638 RepID=D7CWC0_TRURR|nr:NADH-quinone oxidoreductase subunit L [Truepera radiovictrix]ADI16070.1 proton-translocating NADH-quinone oxidoreductase, chain L [Truepera radiovictrix DSM 17093]WMT58303.1 NADH-quinone oxidoreductase subunit L [Truepera radiovictrix]